MSTVVWLDFILQVNKVQKQSSFSWKIKHQLFFRRFSSYFIANLHSLIAFTNTSTHHIRRIRTNLAGISKHFHDFILNPVMYKKPKNLIPDLSGINIFLFNWLCIKFIGIHIYLTIEYLYQTVMVCNLEILRVHKIKYAFM